jgi:hypothetical protein
MFSIHSLTLSPGLRKRARGLASRAIGQKLHPCSPSSSKASRVMSKRSPPAKKASIERGSCWISYQL